MKTIHIAFILFAVLLLPGLSQEAKQPAAHTPQTVIIERFEAREAKISDVIEALALIAENATNKAWKPNFVLAGEGIGDKTISMDLTKAPLAEALAQIAKVPDLAVKNAADSITISSRKSVAR